MEEPKRCMNISDLTDDLLMEILVRIPFKSAFRCKSISKRWFALISNPYFTRSFLRHYLAKKKWQQWKLQVNFFSKEVLLLSREYPEVDFPLTPSFLPCFQTSQEEEASVVGSSEGLLLCCSTRDNKKIYYVCNPLTKHWAVLPPNPSSQEQQEVRIGFFCYHSYHNSQYWYEVVLLTEFLGSKSQIKVETFSSVTGQWTKFVVSCPHNIEINSCRSAITYDRKLHWFMPSDNKILVYDPSHHKVHAIIDGPEEADPHLGSQCFDFYHGGLRIARLRNLHTPECSLSMWRLCNNTGKWWLEHQVNLKELPWKDNSQPPKPAKMRSLRKVKVLALDPYADIVFLGLKSRHVIACDLKTKILKLGLSSRPPSELPLQALRHVILPWPTPVPALPLPRSKREADGTEVEDGEVDVDMATRRIKRAKMMPAAVWE